jgi:hypothetical protein
VGSPLVGYTPNKEYSFLMISPKLFDFLPFFFLISSPLGIADFLVLLELSGDGYSLLCSKKQPPRHTPPLHCRSSRTGPVFFPLYM